MEHGLRRKAATYWLGLQLWEIELHGGPAGYERERLRQAAWLPLGLGRVTTTG